LTTIVDVQRQHRKSSTTGGESEQKKCRSADHHGVISLGIDNLFNPAFDVRGQAGQYRRSGPALHKRFSIYRRAVRTGREEKPPGDLMLPVCDDVERGDPAFRQVFEHVAFPAHRRHDQGRLKRLLARP
jgi:hypothetical protein